MMRFSKSSINSHYARGATSKQAKSRSVQKQAHPVKRIHFTDVKPLRQFLMILSTILVQKGFQKWAQAEVSASLIKGNQISSKV